MNQVNASQFLWQTIGNTHSGLQSLTNIITERLDNIQISESNNYFGTEKEYKKETTQNKVAKPLTSLLRINQSIEEKQRR